MKVKDLEGKKILILGLGRDGKSTLSYLEKHLSQKIDTADEKDGKDYLKGLLDYDLIIKSPGITPFLPEIEEAKQKGKIVTSSTAIFFEEFKGIIVGVTGTKGKSTTASLIYTIIKNGGLKAELIGNIGNPPLDYLDDLDDETIVVFELSSYQLDGLEKSPHIGVFTNFYPEHLNYHKSLENYLTAKFNITKNQTENDYFVFNSDFEELKKMAQITKAAKIPYSKDSYIGDLNTKLLGEVNEANIAAAMVVGQILLIDYEEIKKAVEKFEPLEHRLEFLGEKNGITFYNDSLATIPQATIAALDALGGGVETLIAGGFDRGIDYAVLGEEIAKSNVKTLILFPDTGEKIWTAIEKIQDTKTKIQKFEVTNMREAVKIAFEKTRKGKIVLLSPASTSFNIFKDYADRGNQFKEAVKNY